MIPFFMVLVSICNSIRVEHDQPTLKADVKLTKLAQDHAEWMQLTGHFQHADHEYAEIIYYGEKPFESWMDSLPHRNILLGPYIKVGFGYAEPYWVGVFK